MMVIIWLMMVIISSGWWLTYPSEKWWSSSDWDDDIPIYEMEKIKVMFDNHQRDYNPQNIGLYNPQSSTMIMVTIIITRYFW